MKKQRYNASLSEKSRHHCHLLAPFAVCHNRKGETIVEVMVAFVLLLIYLTAVTAMMSTATRITSLATRRAEEFQVDVNQLALQQLDFGGGNESEEMMLMIRLSNGENSILQEIHHQVEVTERSNLLYFLPR